MNAGLKIWPNHECILTKLKDDLAKMDTMELASTIVVLPTRRFAVNLLASLGQEKSAFLPPQIKTIEEFVLDVAKTQKPFPVVSKLGLELLLASLIKKNNYRHIQLGDEHEIAQFFNDISEIELGIHAFLKLKEVCREDQFHFEEHTKILEERFDELEHLFQLVTDKLLEKNMYLHADFMVTQTKIASEKNFTEFFKDSKVFFVGFTTVKPYFLAFLQKIILHENIEFWLSSPPELYGSENPLMNLIHSIAPQSIGSIKPSNQEVNKNTFVLESNHLLQEISSVVQLVEHYLEQGVKPSHIAILLTNEQTHGKPLRTLLKQKNIECNLAISLKLSQTIVGSWLHCLRKICFQQQDIKNIIAFISHPITLKWIAAYLCWSQKLSELKSLLIYYLCQQNETNGLLNIKLACEDLTTTKVLQHLQETLEQFFIRNSAGPDSKPLTEWLTTFSEIMNTFQIFDLFSQEEKDIQASIENCVDGFINDCFITSETSDTVLSSHEFDSLIIAKLLSEEVRKVGYPLWGVQVLSLIESRYIPFQVTIVLGCTEGNFPKALPADNLVDEWYKTRIGMPGWKYIESLEDTTFNLLRMRLPHLILSYSLHEHDEPTVRSRFIESILSKKQGSVLKLNPEYFSQSNQKSMSLENYTLKQKQQDIGFFNHPRAGLIRTMSATSLEKLITCPYKFLMSKLNLLPLEIPSIKNAMMEGELLHQVLETLFTSEINSQKVIEEFHLPEFKVKEYIYQRLIQTTKIVLPKKMHQSALFRHLADFSWIRYAQHFENIYMHGKFHPEKSQKEFKIKTNNQHHQSSISILGDSIAITGSIDSIDAFDDYYLLTDYKRKSTPANSKVQSGLNPQLTLYAKALENLKDKDFKIDLDKIIAGYWSILGGSWETQFVGEEAKDWAIQSGICSKRTPDSKNVFNNMNELWSWRHETIFKKSLAFAPDAATNDWCTYCSYQDVCRLNDPSYQIAEQGKLKEKLQKDTSK